MLIRIALLLALAMLPAVSMAQRPGIPEAETYADLLQQAPAEFAFSYETPVGFNPRSASQTEPVLRIFRQQNANGSFGSRWSEIDLPFPYWATTTDPNHNTGKYRLNTGRRGVRFDLEFTVMITDLDFETPDKNLSKAWATIAQFHGTPSFGSDGKKLGTTGQTSLAIRMDGKEFLGRPHWAARLHGKTNPAANRSEFETALDVRFMTAHVGQVVTFRGSWLKGLDGSDGWPVGRSLLTYDLGDGQQHVIYDHAGPNYMAVRNEPNTAQSRPRLGFYVDNLVQKNRGQAAEFSNIRGRYVVESVWPWNDRIGW